MVGRSLMILMISVMGMVSHRKTGTVRIPTASTIELKAGEEQSINEK